MARRHQISAMIGDTDPQAAQAASGAVLLRAFGGVIAGLLLLSAP
jgi:hypothetical protein